MSISAPEPVPTGLTGLTGTPAATTAATGATASATPTDQMGKDTFLKLMVAQLRNQDPMNPTDSTAFLAQTAQFTSLEKMQDLADRSAQALSAQMAFGASGLVGKPVTFLAEDGTETDGSVSSVRFTASGPLLHVNDLDVPLSSIVTVNA